MIETPHTEPSLGSGASAFLPQLWICDADPSAFLSQLALILVSSFGGVEFESRAQGETSAFPGSANFRGLLSISTSANLSRTIPFVLGKKRLDTRELDSSHV